MTAYDSSTNQAAAELPHVEHVHFVDMDLPSGDLRLHTRIGTVSWGGFDWLGVGKFGDISDIDEDAALRPSGVTVTLSGVDSALITSALTEDFHGRSIAVYEGFLNLTTMALVDTPETKFKGLMDFMSIELGPNGGSITVQCEGELARWQRHRGSLYTHESQQAIYSGDRGFDQIPFTQNRKIDWRKSNVWQAESRALRGRKIAKRIIGS
jgi:hypothetical protein